MSLNIDELKNKIKYRSTYRGTKEMSVLLESFVNDIVNKLDMCELKKLLDLLKIDDDTLYKYKNGINTEFKINENKITKMFKNYIYIK